MDKIDDKGIFKLNLQLFGDGLFEGGTPPDIPNPILSDGDNSNDNDNQNQDDGATDVTDNNVDVQNNAEPIQTTVNNNGMDDIRGKLDTILNRMQTPAEPAATPPEVPEEIQLTQEEIDKLNNDFYMQFTEKPLDAINKLIEEQVEARANEKVKPLQDYVDNIQKMDYWNQQINAFEKEHPDFKEMVNDISAVIQSDESIRNSKNPLELAYKVVKADKLEAQVRPLDEQLKDSNILKGLLNNPEVKNLIVQELKLNKDAIPNVIGADGKTNINVGDKPKSVEDATKAWLNS